MICSLFGYNPISSGELMDGPSPSPEGEVPLPVMDIPSSSTLTSSLTHTDDEEVVRQQKNIQTKLLRAAVVCLVFVFIEIIGGLKARSLAIMSDAAHLFTDFLSLLIAVFANYLASLPPTKQHNFGLKRVESLAALFSSLSLVGVTFYLVYEASCRFWKHLPNSNDDILVVEENQDDYDDLILENNDTNAVVDGAIMSGTAILGVLVNIILALLLGGDHVHMPGDASHSHSHDGPDGSSCNHIHTGGFMCAHELMPEKESEQEMVCLVASPSCSETDEESSSSSDDEEAGTTSRKMRYTSSIMRPIGSPQLIQPHYKPVATSSSSSSPPPQPNKNVNLQAAYLHVLADLAQSVAVLIGGFVIWIKPGWNIIDPILTIGFSILVIYSSIGIIRNSFSILLEEVPPGIVWQDVYDSLSKVPNVNNIHNLHIWSISSGEIALTVHCVSPDPNSALRNINETLSQRFGIQQNVTIQIQKNRGGVCITCQGKEVQLSNHV